MWPELEIGSFQVLGVFPAAPVGVGLLASIMVLWAMRDSASLHE